MAASLLYTYMSYSVLNDDWICILWDADFMSDNIITKSGHVLCISSHRFSHLLVSCHCCMINELSVLDMYLTLLINFAQLTKDTLSKYHTITHKKLALSGYKYLWAGVIIKKETLLLKLCSFVYWQFPECKWKTLYSTMH